MTSAVLLPFLDEKPNVPLGSLSGQWMRSGTCDQCAKGPTPGECCTKLTLPVVPSAANNPDVVAFFALHGVAIKWWGDMPLAILPLRCQALTHEGNCSLYGKPERPEMCRTGPSNPWGNQLNPACSYKFEWAEE